MQTIERELKAVNCGQKSFYHKAHVIEYYNEQTSITESMHLKSYNTIVASITNFQGEVLRVQIQNMYSKTTRRHIKDFIIQMIGLQAWTKIETGYSWGETEWTF